ncbi:protein of unknown function DUF43 [Methanocaldococcus infernus ME]|uniref:N(4)-bis(aminopropyl)spermidine synthase C-terminal domain-containing protein n=1 Tax=Methanocaldococcus infernus (strain DSM 11812 / JCM 15783 / ME) TaxID=573063 RepID=D5VU75_METIM|nr:bis-aminopropyl spermidine synthase family protein [Methanocaldococcus infernus]ADG12687.1 protein of unknown function DUF43 [Methanocaldococcus infernus ME]
MIIGKMGKGKVKEREDRNLLKRVAKKVNISEGERGVEDILRVIYRNQPISTKRIAQLCKLPLPIVAKVRTILERERILKRENGAVLTEKGLEFVENVLKFKFKGSLRCPLCEGRGIVLNEFFKEILEKVKPWFRKRPEVNTLLDQSYATPETSVYRAALMCERGDLEGKRIIFIGDDDLTSLPVALTQFPEEVYVVDIDERLLNLIKSFSEKEGVKIRIVKHDLRKEMPEELKNNFDVFSTDPPYTIDGLKLFLSRGVECLGEEGVAYLSYSHKPIDEWLKVQEEITKMNFVISELIPNFNYYEGSEIIGNTTFIARLIGKRLKVNIGDTEKIYTGLVKPTVRYYKCLKCGKIHKLLNERIESLRCECGSKKFRMIKREKLS